MDEVGSAHIPHFEVQTLIEVGIVVGLFGLAMGCMACSLNGTRGCEGICFRNNKLCKFLRRKFGNGERNNNNNSDSDSDGESYIDDAESGQEQQRHPAPHVFESLNELVFFDDEGPATSTTNEQESGGSALFVPSSMDKIFPDLLAPNAMNDEEENPESSNNNLREPLL